MTPADILAVQRCIDNGMLGLIHVPTDTDGNPTYRFKVGGQSVRVEFEFFCDAGDWDYLSSVRLDGQEIADYKKLNAETHGLAPDYEEQELWLEVGRWMPRLPRWTELEYGDDDDTVR